MANDKVYKYYQDLPSWAKGVVIIGALGVTYLVGSTIYKKINSAIDAQKQKEEVNQANIELNKLKAQGQNLSFAQTQFNNWSNELVGAFSGCHLDIIPLPTALGDTLSWSNTGIKVREIFKQLNNNVDYLQLQNTFGVRNITKSIICGGDIKMNLPSLVKNQLGRNEIAALNDILNKKGITYKF